MTREPFRTASADKFNTPILADFGAAAHQYETDLAGALDVGAAARLQIGRLYFDGTENAIPFDFFSHAKLRQLISGSVTDVDRAILEHNLICGPLCAFKNFLRRFGAAQVNGAYFASQMEGNRGQPEAFLKHGRQQMLAGVLLHVVETAGAGDVCPDLPPASRVVNDVGDSVLSHPAVD